MVFWWKKAQKWRNIGSRLIIWVSDLISMKILVGKPILKRRRWRRQRLDLCRFGFPTLVETIVNYVNISDFMLDPSQKFSTKVKFLLMIGDFFLIVILFDSGENCSPKVDFLLRGRDMVDWTIIWYFQFFIKRKGPCL